MIALLGMVSGFSSSAPLGPINFWITGSVISRKDQGVRWFIMGVILADLGHALAASWGYLLLLRQSPWGTSLHWFSGLLLLIIGLKSFRSSSNQATSVPDKGENVTHSSPTQYREFLLGFLMCAINPAFLVFWVTVFDLMQVRLGINLTKTQLGIFLTSLSLGDLLWFILLIKLSQRGRDMATPRAISLIRRTIALSFIVIGLATLAIQAKT
jgi:threonine/homoserine/homoserine lactone efflux protein